MILGHGQAYPSSDRILDNNPMHVDYIKIYVDGVVEKYKGYPIPPHTMKPEEVTDMGSTQGNFIQWPRKAIKLLNTDSRQESDAYHQQPPPDYSECYMPAPPDEGHMEFQEEVNTGVSFMDLLNIEIPIPPSHNKDVADPKVIETAPTRPVRSEHVPIPHVSTEPVPTQPVSTEPVLAPLVSTEPVLAPRGSTEPVRTTPVSKPKKKNTNIAKLLRKVKKRRPENIYRLVEELALKANESATVAVTSPNGMYKEPEVEHVEIKELMNLSLDKWAELGTLNWYIMYLYALGEINSLNKTAYFNPHYIALNAIEANENLAINHIKSVMKYHKKRQYFMAPYLAGY
ncbi:hypothetical protein HanHA300_Chr01g0006301 [Helianthus annuus]|nr:hypothetical protein HanHA300_Chr05g0164161 [Helianthus annuus]KAJ0610667.1 hypothetical protein HanHA300_Chr01g0006301 [Helianthus annuus]